MERQEPTRSPVDVRDVVWVYPDQHARHGMPRGFALRIDRVLGSANREKFGPGQVWVCGPYFEPERGRFSNHELTLIIDRFQPLAVKRDQPPMGSASAVVPARIVVDGRTYARRY